METEDLSVRPLEINQMYQKGIPPNITRFASEILDLGVGIHTHDKIKSKGYDCAKVSVSNRWSRHTTGNREHYYTKLYTVEFWKDNETVREVTFTATVTDGTLNHPDKIYATDLK